MWLGLNACKSHSQYSTVKLSACYSSRHSELHSVWFENTSVTGRYENKKHIPVYAGHFTQIQHDTGTNLGQKLTLFWSELQTLSLSNIKLCFTVYKYDIIPSSHLFRHFGKHKEWKVSTRFLLLSSITLVLRRHCRSPSCATKIKQNLKSTRLL